MDMIEIRKETEEQMQIRRAARHKLADAMREANKNGVSWYSMRQLSKELEDEQAHESEQFLKKKFAEAFEKDAERLYETKGGDNGHS